MLLVLEGLFLTTPLIIAATLHMIFVRFRLLQGLANPIDLNLFGANKTWRGVLLMPIFSVIGVGCAQSLLPWIGFPAESISFSMGLVPWWGLGLCLGMAYIAAELPNSYFKRRMGIPAGRLPEKNAFWFSLLDRIDSAIGCALVYIFVGSIPALVAVVMMIVSPLVHFVMVLLVYALGIKKTWY